MWYKIKKIYVGTQQVRPKEIIPTSWLLWYRPLQSDLKDASGNWKDWSWYSGTGSFETVWGYTWARVTENSSRLTTQHIKLESITYNAEPISLCWWIRFNYLARGYWVKDWDWLITNIGSSWYFIWVKSPESESSSYVRWWDAGGFSNNNSNATVTTWNWYCIVATMSNSQIKIYMNWQLKVTSSIWINPWTSASYWKIGAAQIDWSSFQWTDWYVRHCAVYNRALTDAEVLQIYNNTK